MPKKLKLNLEDIKVQSFVTGLDDDILKKMNGGTVGGAPSHEVTKCCETPQTLCGMSSPCQTNCSPPPEAC